MTEKRLEVGDRIRARISIHGVSMGASGTIRRVLAGGIDLYDVQFDNHPNLYAVRGSHLEHIEDVPQAEHQRALQTS